MTVPNPALDRRLAAAAELRAAGNSWEAVATSLHCKAATCRRWPVRYRLRWRELYAAASERRDAELRAEAQTVLRAQLRLDSVKEKRDAAKVILAATRRDRDAGHDAGGDPFPAYVNSIPHEHHTDLADASRLAIEPGPAD